MGRSKSLLKNVGGSLSRQCSRKAVKEVHDYMFKKEKKKY